MKLFFISFFLLLVPSWTSAVLTEEQSKEVFIMAPEEDIIVFADSVVKELCVSNWDSNKDGKLSKHEAAAVTSIGTTFREKAITSFNELRFFTGISNLDNHAFRGCLNLSSIQIPNTVTSFGSSSFAECKELTSLEIPNSVTTIGLDAFYGSGLTSITIPNSVTIIDYGAFWNCKNLTSVELPKYITKIEMDTFRGCTDLASIVIPNSVTTICCNAFYGCTSLKYLEIPNSVSTIEQGAFDGCTGLLSINIDCTSWNYSFFSNKSIKEVSFGSNVIRIGAQTFLNCTNLIDIKISNDFVNIGEEAFHNTAWYNNQSDGVIYVGKQAYTYKGTMPQGTFILLKEGTLGIADYAFDGCLGLASIEIPNSITKIGGYAFNNCLNLTKVITPNIAAWCNIQFSGSNSNPLNYAHHLYSDENSEITNLIIPNTVTSIGELAFCYCLGLESVIIPNSVVFIGKDAFSGCLGLKNVEIGNSVISILNFAFNNCSSLTNLEIPNSVTNIGYGAFRGCTGLKKLIVPDIAAWCNISFGNDDSNPLYYAHQLHSDENTEITNLVIPNSVSQINNYAFYNCSGLTSVVIPSSVKCIGESAFYGCSDLTSIEIPNSVTRIGRKAFYGTPWHTNLPKGMVYVGKVAYAYNGVMPSGTSISLEKGTLGIASGALSSQTGLKRIVIPNSVLYIGDDAFASCSYLENVEIGNSVTSIGKSAFQSCSNLANIEIPSSVTSVGKSAFQSCSNLANIEIPSSVTSVGELAFDHTLWYNNQSNGIVYAGKVAYKYKGDMPSGTYSITLQEGTLAIADNAFSNCSTLKNIKIPNSVTSIGKSSFQYCTKLTSIEIPNSVTSIGYLAFNGCSGLTRIEIPNSVSLIGESAFSFCVNLKCVVIPNSVTSISSFAFQNCTGLTEIYWTPNADTNLSGSLGSAYLTGTTRTLYLYKTIENASMVNSLLISLNGQFKEIIVVNDGVIPVTGINFEQTSIILSVGESALLTATVLPDDASNKELVWSSADENVATVEDGYVTAVGVGTTTITATSTDGSEISASCEVTVTKIPDDTDIALYDNILYFSNKSVPQGSQTTLSLNMKNKVDVVGFQCDVYLPKGITIATDKEDPDFLQVYLSTDRTTSRKTDGFYYSVQDDGALRILCSSTNNYTFEGKNGEVATIVVNVAPDIPEGDHPLIIKTERMTDKGSKRYTVDFVKSTLTVFSCTKGDANNDKEVDVSDFASTANFILGTPPDLFVEKAADVNEDGDIDVSDLTGIANIILTGSPTGKKEVNNRSVDIDMKALVSSIKTVSEELSDYDNILYLKDTDVVAGESSSLSIQMKNTADICGFQFDLYLPDGITIAADEEDPDFLLVDLSTERTSVRRTDFFQYRWQSDGALRVLCSSTKSYSFEGNDGEVCTIRINVSDAVEEGKHNIQMRNIRMTDVTSEKYPKTGGYDLDFPLTVHNESNPVESMEYDGMMTDKIVYDLQGRRVEKPAKGFYIINGKKRHIK